MRNRKGTDRKMSKISKPDVVMEVLVVLFLFALFGIVLTIAKAIVTVFIALAFLCALAIAAKGIL